MVRYCAPSWLAVFLLVYGLNIIFLWGIISIKPSFNTILVISFIVYMKVL